MKAFIYNGEQYIRCVPGKNLFKSTMVHEVVNRGDIFAIRVSDSQLTIVPGSSQVEHYDAQMVLIPPTALTPLEQMAEELRVAIQARNERKQLKVGDCFRPNAWRVPGYYQVAKLEGTAVWCIYFCEDGTIYNGALRRFLPVDLREGFTRVN